MINIPALLYDSFPPCHISKGKLKRDKIISKYNTRKLFSVHNENIKYNYSTSTAKSIMIV